MLYPWRITFVTNPRVCNLACRDCFRLQAGMDWMPREPMPIALVRRVVSAFAPYGLREIIPSTSGEPLLYQEMDAFVDLAQEYGLKVNLTTNGTFPGRGVKAWAARLLPVLSDVKISMRGFEHSTNSLGMEGLDSAAQRQNILDFLEARAAYRQEHGQGPTVSLQLALTEETSGELESLKQWANQVGIDRVKAHGLWKLGEERPPAQGQCPFLGREAWVWADGSFQVCPSPEARYTASYALGDFGNFALEDPLKLWQGEAYRQFMEHYATHPLCSRCPMRF